MKFPIRIVLADDQPFYLEGLASILRQEKEFALLGHARNGEELLRQVEHHQPDIAIVDIELPLSTASKPPASSASAPPPRV